MKPLSARPGAALALLVLAMLALCLWPFTVRPPNGVSFSADGAAVGLRQRGMIVSRDAFPPLASLAGAPALSVEIALRPAVLIDRYVAAVVTFDSPGIPPPLMVGTWKGHLIVRLGDPAVSRRRDYREIGIRDTVDPGKTIFVTVASGPEGTAVYVDGALRRTAPNIRIDDRGAGLGRLLLGVSPTGGAEWRGDILELTVYDRALNQEEVRRDWLAFAGGSGRSAPVPDGAVARYDLREGAGGTVRDATGHGRDLLVPDVFAPPRRAVLAWPGRDELGKPSLFRDLLLNVLGFVPFGLLAARALRRVPQFPPSRVLGIAVAAGFSLSLLIELAQAFLPGRTSSLTDLLTNTAGTAVGVLISRRLTGKRVAPRAGPAGT